VQGGGARRAPRAAPAATVAEPVESISEGGAMLVLMMAGTLLLIVANFLVNNKLPSARITKCPGVTVDEYVPIAPTDAADFANLLEALSWTETEISYLPEYYYWDAYTPSQVGCPLGGTFAFESDEWGAYLYKFDECSFAEDFIFTGTGKYDPYADRFTLAISTQGRWQCDATYIRAGERTRIAGNCDGTTFRASGRILSPVQRGPSSPHSVPGKHK
jgi:hypothetical protein